MATSLQPQTPHTFKLDFSDPNVTAFGCRDHAGAYVGRGGARTVGRANVPGRDGCGCGDCAGDRAKNRALGFKQQQINRPQPPNRPQLAIA